MSDPAAWGLGEGLITPQRKKSACYEMLQTASEFDQWRALVNKVTHLLIL
jgi:hypothetical protein